MLIQLWERGQLCNRLCFSAQVMAFALEHKLGVLNPTLAPYRALFPNVHRNPLGLFPRSAAVFPPVGHLAIFQLLKAINHSKKARRWLNCVRNTELEEIPERNAFYRLDVEAFTRFMDKKNIIISGFGLALCASELVAKHQAQICDYFRFSDSEKTKVCRVLGEKRGAGILVGVHIRRGDYKTYLGGRYYWDREAYLQIVRTIKHQLYPAKAQFLFCSNEADFFNHEFPEESILTSGGIAGDLLSLSMCDLIVGPPSTFSLWAAFMGSTPLAKFESATECLSAATVETVRQRRRAKVIDFV